MGCEGLGIGACGAGRAGVQQEEPLAQHQIPPVLFTPSVVRVKGLGGNGQGCAAFSSGKRWGTNCSCILLPCLLSPATSASSNKTNNGPDIMCWCKGWIRHGNVPAVASPHQNNIVGTLASTLDSTALVNNSFSLRYFRMVLGQVSNIVGHFFFMLSDLGMAHLVVDVLASN